MSRMGINDIVRNSGRYRKPQNKNNKNINQSPQLKGLFPNHVYATRSHANYETQTLCADGKRFGMHAHGDTAKGQRRGAQVAVGQWAGSARAALQHRYLRRVCVRRQ